MHLPNLFLNELQKYRNEHEQQVMVLQGNQQQQLQSIYVFVIYTFMCFIFQVNHYAITQLILLQQLYIINQRFVCFIKCAKITFRLRHSLENAIIFPTL